MDDKAVKAMTRLQIALWLPAKCSHCNRPYESVDDFLARNPRAGFGWEDGPVFVDDSCWGSYEEDQSGRA